MFKDFAKTAFSIGVLAVVAVGGAQNHWFERGDAALRALLGPRAAVTPPPPTAQQYAVSYAAPAPQAQRPRPSWGTFEISPDAGAQYRTEVEINGVRVHALVDTGATYVALTAEDARALNIDPPPSAFTWQTSTANGVSHVAPVHLSQARVGDITVYDVDAVVTQPGALQISLLGMSFLKKLSSFQNADGRLVLKQ